MIPVELPFRSKCFAIIMLFKWFSCYSVMWGETCKRRQIDSFMFISFLVSKTSFVNPERYSMVFVQAQSLYWFGPCRNVKVGLCAVCNFLFVVPESDRKTFWLPTYFQPTVKCFLIKFLLSWNIHTLILELKFWHKHNFYKVLLKHLFRRVFPHISPYFPTFFNYSLYCWMLIGPFKIIVTQILRSAMTVLWQFVSAGSARRTQCTQEAIRFWFTKT